MATTPALMSIEQYLRTSYKPDVDFVDGEIEERNLGEFDHGRLQGLLAAYFLAQEKEWKITGLIGQRIRVAARRVRICDLVLLRSDAPREKVTETPPLVCLEILSPEDRLSRAEKVLADYEVMGVANIWLLDPMRRVAYEFRDGMLQRSPDGVLQARESGLRLEAESFFAALD